MITGIRWSLREIVRSLGFTNYQQHYYGLSVSQVHTIVELDFHKQLTAQDLTNILLLDKSTVSRMLDRMEKLDIIVITTNHEDARSKVIKLSQTGLELADKINKGANSQIQDALTLLTEEEQLTAKNGVALIAMALTKKQENI